MSATTSDAWSRAKAIFGRHAIREQSDNSVFICRVHEDGAWDTTWWANIVFVKGPHDSGSLVITGDFDPLVVKHRFTSLKGALAFVVGGAPDNSYLWEKIRAGMSGYASGLYEFSAENFVRDVREALDDLEKGERLSHEQLTDIDTALCHIEWSEQDRQESIRDVLDAMPDGGDWEEWVSMAWGRSVRRQVECVLAGCCRAHELLEAASQGQGAEVAS